MLGTFRNASRDRLRAGLDLGAPHGQYQWRQVCADRPVPDQGRRREPLRAVEILPAGSGQGPARLPALPGQHRAHGAVRHHRQPHLPGAARQARSAQVALPAVHVRLRRDRPRSPDRRHELADGRRRRQGLGALRGLSGPGQARSADGVLRALPAHDHALLLRSAGSRGLQEFYGVSWPRGLSHSSSRTNQRQPRAGLKQRFEALWQDLCDRPAPKPGSM